jgi:hypothetical protein
LHSLGRTKHFVLNANAFALCASGKDEGNTTATAASAGPAVRPTEKRFGKAMRAGKPASNHS